MKKLILTIACCFMFLVANAKVIQIKGNVTDSLIKEPLSLSSLHIYDMSQKAIFSALVYDSTGYFEFDVNISNAKYYLIIGYTGYKKKTIEFDGAETGKILNLGEITLTPTSDILDEVTVTAKPNIRTSIDRTEYLIDSARLAKATTTSDILRGIPEIMYNEISRAVSIAGKENTLVLINGVNTGVSSDLRTVNPQDIEKVEVITTPSSGLEVDYDAVINIILKNEPRRGMTFDGDFTLMPNLHSEDLYVGFTFGTEKLRTNVSYLNYYRNHSFETGESRTNTITGENIEYEGYCSRAFEIMHTANVNLDYYADKKNFFNITTKTVFYSSEKNVEYKSYANGEFIGNYERPYKGNFYNGNYTLFYRHSANERSNLSVNLNFTFLTDKDRIGAVYEGGKEYFNDESGKKFATNLRVDYEKSLTDRIKVNIGTQPFFQRFTGSLAGNSAENRFRNYRYNGYFDVYYTYKSYKARLGLKAEENINVFDDADYGEIRHSALYPTFMLSKQLGKYNLLNFEYRKLSYYPSAWNLAPYTEQTDSMTIRTGNPALKPYVLNSYEITHTVRKPSLTFNTSIFYNNTDKFIVPKRTYDENLFGMVTYANDAKRDRIGVRMNGSITIGGFLEIKPDIRLFHEKYNVSENTRYNNTHIISASILMGLPAGFAVGVFGSSTGKILTYQGYIYPTHSIDVLYVIKRFEKKDIRIFAGYQYLVQTSDREYIVSGDYEQNNRLFFNTKGLIFRVTWSFKSGKPPKPENITTYFDNDTK